MAVSTRAVKMATQILNPYSHGKMVMVDRNGQWLASIVTALAEVATVLADGLGRYEITFTILD
jgi:hypothetical protein